MPAALGTTGSLPRSSYEGTAALLLLTVSPVEAEFFAAGDQLSEVHDFSDLEDGAPRTFWRSVVGWLRGERTQHPE